MLNYKIEKEAFDLLGDDVKALYKTEGEGYQLEVDGVADKSKLDEFRTSNVNLMQAVEKFKDVDLDKYNDLIEQQTKIRNKDLIDKGDFDTLLKESTNTMRSDFESKLAALTTDNEAVSGKYNNLVTKHEIEGAATKAFSEFRIAPEAHEAVMAQIKSKFSLDGGVVVAKNGDQIESGKDGNLTVSEFVESQPEMFKIPSVGGRGNGGEGAGSQKSELTSTQRIAAALAKK